MSRRPFLVAALLLTASTPALAQNAAPTQASAPAGVMRDSLAHARRLVQWFYTSQVDSLLPFVPEQDREKVTKDRLLGMVAQLASRVGGETEVIEEKFVKRNGATQYWRTAKYALAPEPMLFRWAFNAQGQVIGQGFGPASQAPPIDP